MKVVLAEKPSQGKDYAKILGCTEKHNGYMSGNGYAVTWAFGHLVSMDRPQEMSQAKDLEDLPIITENPGFNVVKDKKNQFSVIESLFNDPDTEEIICGTDAGREGEHIFRLIYNQAGCTKPTKRLWISSLTKAAIEKGFQSLRPGQEFESLAAAALCRAKADMHVGLNFSIAHSIHNRQKVTTGRVQTPTLAIVAQRELDIQKFKSSFYYEIIADLDGFKAKYINSEGKHNIDDKAAAQSIFENIKNADTATVTKIESREKQQKPPALYSLLTLQMDANKLFGLTAEQTLKVAQSLYETRKLLSYPRTESNHLGGDMVDGLPEIIKNLPDLCGDSVNVALDRIKEGLSLGKEYVNDAKLTDHHAIIPTGEVAVIDDLSMDERDIYLLVCERFLSIFLPNCISQVTKVDLTIKDQIFKSSGTVITDPGWKKALTVNKSNMEDNELPVLEENQAVTIKKMGLDEKQTKPPVRFNDASLLKEMKTAGKRLDDKDLAAYMKENGIGTSATRGGIIEKLIDIGYLAREKKNIIPTTKGMQRFKSELDELKSPKLTGEWEQKLSLIESGKYDPAQFDQEIEAFIKSLIPQVAKTKKIERQSFGACPVCGKGQVVESVKGFGCSEYKNGCRFVIWKTIAKQTITADHVKQLLESGKTTLITGFKNSKGKVFDAYLELRDGEIKMVFEQINCPVCNKGYIFESEKGFGCSNWKEGNCKFYVQKTILGKRITKAQVKTLTEKGKSGLITGFKGKSGKTFDAHLILKEGKIEFEFPQRTKGKGGKTVRKNKKQRTNQRGAKK